MAFSKAVTSAKFPVIRFRWSQVSSHRWSSCYHRTFSSQIIRPFQITYPIRVQQTARFTKKNNGICERKFSRWCDNESIQMVLISFKNADLCYTRFIFSTNHCKGLLTCECSEKLREFNFWVYALHKKWSFPLNISSVNVT